MEKKVKSQKKQLGFQKEQDRNFIIQQNICKSSKRAIFISIPKHSPVHNIISHFTYQLSEKIHQKLRKTSKIVQISHSESNLEAQNLNYYKEQAMKERNDKKGKDPAPPGDFSTSSAGNPNPRNRNRQWKEKVGDRRRGEEYAERDSPIPSFSHLATGIRSDQGFATEREREIESSGPLFERKRGIC